MRRVITVKHNDGEKQRIIFDDSNNSIIYQSLIGQRYKNTEVETDNNVASRYNELLTLYTNLIEFGIVASIKIVVK